MNETKQRPPKPLDHHYPFNAASIDAASEAVYACLIASGIERKNAMRFRLSLEEILLTWQQSMGGERVLCCRLP